MELWRAGGLNEGQELAYPVGVSASPAGRVAIADFQLSEVVVVERDGTWGGPWGRRGRGPGELSTPVATVWDRAGRLAVFDVVAPKVLFLEDGEPVTEDVAVAPAFTAPVVSSGQLVWAGVAPDGATLLQPTPEPGPDPSDPGLRTALLLRLRPGRGAADTLVRTTIRTLPEGRHAGWSIPGWPRLLSAVGTDGAVAVGGTDASYRISIYGPDGSPTRQICRDAAPLPVTNYERGVGVEAPEALAQAITRAPLPDTPAAFGRIFWGARGRLWVQRDRPSPSSNTDTFFGPGGARYDVFDEQGHYLGEVRAPPRARLQTASGDTVWALEFGEMDEAWIVAYHLSFE